jgi:hypothetical protein
VIAQVSKVLRTPEGMSQAIREVKALGPVADVQHVPDASVDQAGVGQTFPGRTGSDRSVAA